jgi:hypothetical protein
MHSFLTGPVGAHHGTGFQRYPGWLRGHGLPGPESTGGADPGQESAAYTLVKSNY